MLYLMIFSCLMIFISYYLFDKDFFSPSFILLIGYFLSAVATFYNTVVWNVVITNKLITIMILGWVSFLIAELFVRKILYKEKRKGGFNRENDFFTIQKIVVHKLFMWILILIDIIILFLFYREVIRIAGSSEGNIVLKYKDNLSENGLSTLVQQLIKYIKGFAYVSGLIFVNNFFSGNEKISRKIINNIIYLIPGVIYIVQCLLNGGRYTVLAYVIGMFFLFYLFVQQRDGWKHKLKIKILVFGIGGVLGVFVLFWAVKELVGRNSTATLIEYITEYIGGSYELFSLYLETPPANYCYETFSGIINSFNKLGITDLPIRTYHEFRFSSTGVLVGNVYTAFRSFYNDYGILGVCLLSFIMSSIFNLMYHKIRFSKNIKNNAFLIILYSSLLYTVVFSFFVDYFYARFSIGLLIEIFIMYIIYLLMIKKRIVFGHH